MWSPNELLKIEKQRDILSYITLQFFHFKKVPLEHCPFGNSFFHTFLYCGCGFLPAEILPCKHAAQQHQTDDIGDERGIHHQKSACGRRYARDGVHPAQKMAVYRGRDAEDAEERGNDDLDYRQRGHIDEQHRGVHAEDVRDDERADRKLGCVDAGLHRIALGDGCACVGCQRDGGSDVGDDAEVEHEEVRRDLGDTDCNEYRRAGGGHDAVVCGGRDAHAEDDAADHGQKQGDHRRVDDGDAAADGNDRRDHLGGEAGRGDAAGDDARHGAGNGDGNGALAAGFERFKDAAEGYRVVAVNDADDDGDEDSDGGGVGHGAGASGDEPDEDDQRQQEVYLAEQLRKLRQLIARDALEAELLGLKVDGDEDAGEVQHRGENGAQRDLGVGDVHVLRHQERGGAHDRGHYLAAGGGRSLDGTGKFRLVAGLFHHGDGDGAGGDGVADGRAGDHAAERGGDDRNLGRPAGKAADERICELNEKFSDTGALKECAEDDEHDDVLCADLYGSAEDAAGSVEQSVEYALDAHAGAEGVDKQHAGYA